MKLLDLTGQKFGRWTVVDSAPHIGRHVSWLCQCDCGHLGIVTSTNLRTGKSRSCGCFHVDVVTTHGKSKSPEFITWTAMKSRCYTKSNIGYHFYGAKGVTVCERWKNSFENFLHDVGEKPGPEYSLDRIDPTGDYSPDNCRWATREMQDNNTRNSRTITYKGTTKTIAQWSRFLGVSKGLLLYRLHSGWSIEAIITKPSYRNKTKPISARQPPE